MFPHITIEAAECERTWGCPSKIKCSLTSIYVNLFFYAEITPEKYPNILDTPCVLEMMRT